MKNFQKFILNLMKSKGIARKVIMSLAIVVVFITTYVLVVPAFTLDRNEAEAQGGIDVPEITAESEEQTQEEGTKGAQFEQNVLTDDGRNYKVSVEYSDDAGVPDGAALEVSEIKQQRTASDGATEYEEYLIKTQEALGTETAVFNYIRIFDISIVDKNGGKVTIKAPVDVNIELADKDTSKKTDENIQIVHFADESEKGEVIEKVEVDGETVSFEAEGFSAYAIVDAPDPASLGYMKIANQADLLEHASSGVYIGNPLGYYMTDGVQTIKGTRKGITKTKPAQDTPADDAVLYYFEPVDGSSNHFKIYCKNDSENKYITQSTNSLNLTTNVSQGTVFTLEYEEGVANPGKFQLRGSNGYYVNMQGGEPGNTFAAWNGTDPPAAEDPNSQLCFWYQKPVESDPYDLDGKSYGLMNWNGGAAGKGMMASSSAANTLDALPMTKLSTSNDSDHLFAPDDSDITMWTFQWVDNDKYYLTAETDSGTKYLKVTADGLSLVDTADENCKLRVLPGSGNRAGEICLKAGSTTLTYSGTAAGGFSTGGSVGNEWLKLVELSETTSDYERTYSAKKVSVSDTTSVVDGSRVIVYTRAWNDTTKSYDFYAVSSDGSLVRVYEKGDSIEWSGGQLNTLLWDFDEHYWDENADPKVPNYYYDLYNEYSGKYIAPQVEDTQILRDEPIGINLNGRRDGKYYTDILAWDADNYAFAGLKVENGTIVTCPKSEAMHFYFAIMEDINVDDDLNTVGTVDNDMHGITMKMINKGTREEMSNYLGNNTGGVGRKLQQGLLSTDLGEDGYPVAKQGTLGDLYNGASKVNHLFIESTYEGSGYFEYDSTQNYATLLDENGNVTSDFTVYKELGTYDIQSNEDRPTLKHGQFFPYNDLKPGVFAEKYNQNLTTIGGESGWQDLSDDDPRKYEMLYDLENSGKKVDPYFAMELEASFTQTPDGKDAWDHDIIFEFTGDDDFWLYVDGELVIDLGGIHSSVPGSVNFKTGDVYVNGEKTTLREVFEKNYKKRNETASDADVAAFLNQYFDEGSTVFRNETQHTMRIFYMERGAGASNLRMRFNLASVKKGEVELSKEVAGTDDPEAVMAEFPYQIYYKTSNDDDAPEYRLTDTHQTESGQTVYNAFYKDTVRHVKYKSSISIEGVTYGNVFFLKHGETAEITLPDDAVSYRIVECGVDNDVYSDVSVKNEDLTETEHESNRNDYSLDYKSSTVRPKVKYKNTVDPDALRSLTIGKKLYEADGETQINYPDDTTTFDFRLYLATEFGSPELAAMHTYHVKDPDGNYCKWNKDEQKFEKIGSGISSYSDLSDEQKKAASFTTSIFGTISRIPIDHTVEVRNVLPGTTYRVEERTGDIPDGYSLQKYDDYDTENASVEPGDDNYKGLGVNGTVVPGKDPNVTVRNLKGFGMRMNKTWTDSLYMADREPTYYAVYVKGENDQLEMVNRTLRKLDYNVKPQTLYWYFERLPDGTVLDDYTIREVDIDGEAPDFDDEGNVTNPTAFTATPLGDGGKLKIDGKQKGAESSGEIEYTVSYDESIPDASNVIVNNITNDRPGVVIKKSKWKGTTPLAGALFTLKDPANPDELIGPFISDEEGLVTVAYLREDTDYILTETRSPQGWYGAKDPFVIRLQDGQIAVSGSDNYYEVNNPESGSADPPVLTVKNRPYELQAVKVDGGTDLVSPLAGAKFALHRQTTVGGVTAIDLNPMEGYEELTTDEDGVIPEINETLKPGTYELRETGAPEDYEMLSSYIRFTVGDNGGITIVTPPTPAEIATVEETDPEDSDGTLQFSMTIKNKKKVIGNVSVWKTDMDHQSITTGAKFVLYRAEDYNDSTEQPKEGAPPVVPETPTGDNGILTLGPLEYGNYRLVETEAPAEYSASSSAIKITVNEQGVSALQAGNQAEVALDSDENPYHEYWVEGQDPGTYQIRVWNSSGVELPNTGGMGTTLFYVFGTLLVAGTGFVLLRRRRKTN